MAASRGKKILIGLIGLVVLAGVVQLLRRPVKRWWRSVTYVESTGRFQDPEGLAVDAEGNIYVADEDRAKLTRLDAEGNTLAEVTFVDGYLEDGKPVHITSGDGMVVLEPGRILAIAQFNLAELEFVEKGVKLVRIIGRGKGTAPEDFGDPEGIALDPKTGEIYVTDEDNRLIKIFGRDGTLLRSWPVPVDPESICVTEDSVYVTFSKDDWIGCYSKDGALKFRFGDEGDGATDNPDYVCLSPSGLLYVTDQGNNRIQVYGLDGTYRFSIGSSGDALGEFDDPEDLAFDPQGNLLVADGGNHRIQVFTKEGTPLREIR